MELEHKHQPAHPPNEETTGTFRLLRTAAPGGLSAVQASDLERAQSDPSSRQAAKRLTVVCKIGPTDRAVVSVFLHDLAE